jgi:hypothetical protein
MATVNRFEDLTVRKDVRIFNQKLVVLLIEKDTLKFGFFLNHVMNYLGGVMDYIAKGFQREVNKAFLSFLYFSKGSAGELRSQVYCALDPKTKYSAAREKLLNKLNRISAQLSLFIRFLNKSEFKINKFKKLEVQNCQMNESDFFEPDNVSFSNFHILK